MSGIVDEYLELAAETDADLVAMQVGDFYEFFAENAETVAQELDLTVSQKSSHGSNYPMAGVPVSELTPYVKTLVERGYRVAVADQHETESGHARSITRVVTPGTLLDTVDAAAQYLATVVEGADAFGLAFVDVTTGRFHVTQVEDLEDALTEVYRFDPAELLPGPELRAERFQPFRDRTDATVTEHDPDAFAPGRATHRLREQFGEGALRSLGIEPESPAVQAAGAALDYVDATGLGVARSFTRLQPYRADDHVELDATTQRNLELTETMQGDTAGSLFETIDHTVTAGGGRLLREWLQRPRQDRTELDRRQAAVEAFTERALARDSIQATLDGALDLERLAGRIAHGTADARDLRAVGETLSVHPAVVETVAGDPVLAESPVRAALAEPDEQAVMDLIETLAEAIVDDPPKTVREGGLFKRGYDPELDEILTEYERAVEWIDSLADREKSRLGITHLQTGRNQTDGYYIQVGRSETDAVPEEYREIKALKNSKRYTTDALEEHERTALRLEERRADLEYELFQDLREQVAERADLLRSVGTALARVDAFASLATHAVRNDWVRPELGESGVDIRAGRHPVVEQTTEFVPNDAALDGERRLQLVTGPNMSGKSTYLRQTALIVLLAQIGSFVPAKEARIGLVDGIYTRVGALDELAQGRSTFMVEMQELSNILHSATADSLVILDEVGRGTATYDGISIAWAATEYLHNEVRAKTLFATHYHELTALADHLDSVVNVHVAAEEQDGTVTFLRTVRSGAADRSYGIHVADLAGVPEPVVGRAETILEKLRAEKAIEARGGGGEPVQTVFDVGQGEFVAESDESADSEPGLDPETAAVIEEVSDLSLAEMTPVEVLSRVESWQERLGENE
ncbi:DNA mismatch repair protein MutS [Halodesulfurarchaeum formicicum]|uniref:DNA mismatch repair protein MutS n=1 Tax=Halodesulfurarchaeum formicicum TaxID=1873524 RepID=A0A1D8S2A0_9EURY|nr:DNA mismatch repair protein MutS [Halodesulfurarchaeum formicicum]AOW79470.1 DNA mismatch repair protein MutS [Halodesulfurarchaeum formicicum]